MGNVALLTRGDERWGTGHLHRAKWLAQALVVQNAVNHVTVCCADSPLARTFFGADSDEACYFADDWIAKIDSRLIDLASVADLVVVDWLNSPAALLSALRSAGCNCALLDDYGPAVPLANLVINSLLAPLERQSRREGRAEIHSGVDFVQLPPAVTKLRGVATATARAMATELRAPVAPSGAVQGVMVSFGGIVRDRWIEQALSCLVQAGYTGQVIVKPAPAVPGATGANVELAPAGEEFHSLLAASDLAICSAGLTLYEAAFLGIPSIALGMPSGVAGFETHQLDTARKLDAAGCCRAAGLAGEVSDAELTAIIVELLAAPARRLELGNRGMQLVDGHGLMRTVELLLGLL